MSLSQSYDEEEFIQEVQAAHKKYRDHYKHEVNKRNEQMAWNEAQANQAMAATIEQDRLAERQLAAKEANEAARQRKRDINAQFWHSIKSVVFIISCAAIAVYTLIHFA
tara:strand:+ start:527 stop:853 length:327 start_codon:yes stop_codon:yes gene_type:complete